MKAFIKLLLREILKGLYNIMYSVLPLSRNVILFESNVGRNYSGNPKYIYKEMVNQGLDRQYKCVWILENIHTEIEGKCRKIKRKRLKYFYYFAIARVWIMDSRQPLYMKKKKGSIYIQTWHGTPLKKLGLDMQFVNMVKTRDIQLFHQEFVKCTERWDYLLSPNTYSTDIFKRCFGFRGKLVEIGYPRNDIFVNKKAQDIDQLRDKYKIDKTKRTILYAPTWRDSHANKDGSYKFNTGIDLIRLSECLDNKYNIIVKPHYLTKLKIRDIRNSNIILSNWEEDIQELCLISDILITDYSSIIFDYVILDKPIIIYAHDIEEYKEKSRDLYFDITQELVLNTVYTQQEVINYINELENNNYIITSQQRLFKDKYTFLENGKASMTCVNIIQKELKKNRNSI